MCEFAISRLILPCLWMSSLSSWPLLARSDLSLEISSLILSSYLKLKAITLLTPAMLSMPTSTTKDPLGWDFLWFTLIMVVTSVKLPGPFFHMASMLWSSHFWGSWLGTDSFNYWTSTSLVEPEHLSWISMQPFLHVEVIKFAAGYLMMPNIREPEFIIVIVHRRWDLDYLIWETSLDPSISN